MNNTTIETSCCQHLENKIQMALIIIWIWIVSDHFGVKHVIKPYWS